MPIELQTLVHSGVMGAVNKMWHTKTDIKSVYYLCINELLCFMHEYKLIPLYYIFRRDWFPLQGFREPATNVLDHRG